jgi:glyoxylase-like metal-dependent hydrolase (beta-lactamase superfamily II)
MEEIAPGLWHWSAVRERIGASVHSCYLVAERVAIDPMLPPEGLEWFETTGVPEHALLTNRHHDRDVWRLREAFGTEVHCASSGLDELAGRGEVSPFDFGEVLPGGVIAYEVDAICPDETALYIPAHRALACADGVVRWPGHDGLTFVPDELMDEPERTKRELRAAYARLLDLDFEILLLAHGAPMLGGGRSALRAFVEAAER